MGGNDIHIRVPTRPERRLVSRICTKLQDFHEKSDRRVVTSDKTKRGTSSCDSLHKCCKKEASTRDVHHGLNLDVLLACRRLYKEAALLPFRCNTFMVDLPDNMTLAMHLDCFPETKMRHFSDYLHPTQREAVRSLKISTLSTLFRENKTQIGRFKGLKKLHIVATGGGELSQIVMCGLLWDEWVYAGGYDLHRLRRLKSVRLTVEASLDCPWFEGAKVLSKLRVSIACCDESRQECCAALLNRPRK